MLNSGIFRPVDLFFSNKKKQEQEDAAAAAAAGLDTVAPRVPTTSRFFRVAQRSVSDPRGDRLGWGRPVAQTVSSPSLDHDHPHRGRGQQELVAGSSGLSQREKEKENGGEDDGMWVERDAASAPAHATALPQTSDASMLSSESGLRGRKRAIDFM